MTEITSESLVADIKHELMMDHGCILNNPRKTGACRACDRRARLIVDRVLDMPDGVLDELKRLRAAEVKTCERCGSSSHTSCPVAPWETQ